MIWYEDPLDDEAMLMQVKEMKGLEDSNPVHHSFLIWGPIRILKGLTFSHVPKKKRHKMLKPPSFLYFLLNWKVTYVVTGYLLCTIQKLHPIFGQFGWICISLLTDNAFCWTCIHGKWIDASKGSIFMLRFMHMMIKSSPFARMFLKEASQMFGLYMYTLGAQCIGKWLNCLTLEENSSMLKLLHVMMELKGIRRVMMWSRGRKLPF